ncbi:acetyl-CoA C-acyltransferase [Marinilongibacter aquaticus]|uniref:acetyl-CoA C-acyltransferase n=1 Tax=Marinilongibacter aquaticus TaxID=2975157 RepID=UPI0021BD68D3|nr:acetyl-CoA C-acyltransferase [Marinilongibacter aquaticus]UBM60570.1 acetyl-CoA C-acyltransferase [Marinilongibacter aquaticus]
MKTVYVLAAKRTPIGSFGGAFAAVSATVLAAQLARNILEELNFDGHQIDEVFLGNVISANLGQAPARQVAVKAGLPNHVPVSLINKVCASGMKAVMLAAQGIQLGMNDLVLAGGMENMSQVPYYLDRARFGYNYGHGQVLDGLARDGLTDPYDDMAMGCFADSTAERYALSREEQDAYAIQSYKRAAKAWDEGWMKAEVLPIAVQDRKGNSTLVEEDEEYKKVFFDKIPKLKPAFTKQGTVTAANASTLNDGAAFLLLASGDMVDKLGAKPIAKITAYADAAREPKWFTLAPILATEKVLRQAQIGIEAIDYFEVNEAFSAVPLAYAKHLNVDQAAMNIFGGAVSLGHPLGCSGARILVTLINVLKQRNAKRGLAAICNGGGGASAMIVESL